MVNHSDLMKRLNASCKQAGMPPDIIEDMDDQGNEWKDVDIRAGHKRIEVVVPVSKLVAFTKKLFRRKES